MKFKQKNNFQRPKNNYSSSTSNYSSYSNSNSNTLTTFIIYAIIIIIVVLIIFYVINNNNKFTENYERIRFLNKDETSQFFKSDPDNYIKNLTPLDVKAQRSISKDDYQLKIIESADSFTPEEIQKLKMACTKADLALKKIKIPGFDGMKASNLSWNLALTRGKNYEDGLPHTRLDTIFLTDLVLKSSPLQLAKTMLHEKVHVYERLFPEDIEVWLNYKGYKPFKKWDEIKNARSNPDINEWAYLDPNGKPMVVLYKSNNPKNIHEVNYPVGDEPASEHPYETLAYYLEKYLN